MVKIILLMCILTNQWKSRAPTWKRWNYCFLKFCQVYSSIVKFHEMMKNSASFNESFTTSWHYMWKFGKMIYQKVDTGISKISIFPPVTWYDRIYWYRTNILKFSIYWSITSWKPGSEQFSVWTGKQIRPWIHNYFPYSQSHT